MKESLDHAKNGFFLYAQDWCHDQDHLGLGIGGSIGGTVTAIAGIKSSTATTATAATAGLSLAVGIVGAGIGVVGLYVVCSSSHWSKTGNLIGDLLLMISQSKDE